jgi:protein-tyrosine-phosphatase
MSIDSTFGELGSWQFSGAIAEGVRRLCRPAANHATRSGAWGIHYLARSSLYTDSAAMTIHFICTGNIYRSRIAEAYCVSKAVPGLRVFSSGIQTVLNRGISIAPYALRILREQGLERFAAGGWRQTTEALVRASDCLVFMEREHYNFCESWIDPVHQRMEIWDLPDVGAVEVTDIMHAVSRTFGLIRQRTDMLLASCGALEPASSNANNIEH